jgi:two-component system, NarL family, nitrate/nitrite response regulator NarL
MNSSQKPVRIAMADDHPMFRAGLRSLLGSSHHLTIVGEASNGSEAVSLVRETRPDVLLLDVAMPLLSGFEVLREISDLHKSVRSILLTADIAKSEVIYALQLGARGVLWKNSAAPLLLKSIECVMNEEVWISRELIADLVDTLRLNPNASSELLPELLRPETLAPAKRQSKRAKPSADIESVSFRNHSGKKFGLTARELEIVKAIVDGQSNRDIAMTFGISEYTVKHHLTRIFDKVGVYSRLELAVFAIHHDLSGQAKQV